MEPRPYLHPTGHKLPPPLFTLPEPPLPLGLRYLEQWLDPQAARKLLTTIDAQLWDDATLRRRVQHYGFRYNYKSRTVTAQDYLGPLPRWVAPLAKRLVREGLLDELPTQVIINEYLPGQGIAPHVDCEPCFGPAIVSLTLGAGCSMEFTPTPAHGKGPTLSRYLAPGSLLLLQGPARYDWRHSIRGVKRDVVDGYPIARGRRVSVTFRTVVGAEVLIAQRVEPDDVAPYAPNGTKPGATKQAHAA